MDNTSPSQAFVLTHRSAGTDIWQKMDQTVVGAGILGHWNPMIRVNVISSGYLAHATKNIPIRVWQDFRHGYLQVQPGFVIDTTTSRCLLQIPVGKYTAATLLLESVPTFQFPLAIGDRRYRFFIHLESEATEALLDTTLTWNLPVPDGFALGNNYPNPFNQSTTFPIQLLFPAEVFLEVYDLRGRKIQTTSVMMFEPGKHLFNLDLSSHASGIYFVHAVARDTEANHAVTRSHSLTLIK